jgi:hypothetical protein
VRDESSQLVRLSTRDVVPADRLSYASWILSSALAPSALSTGAPSAYELEVTALELPSIAVVAQRGSPQRAIRARPEIRRREVSTAQIVCDDDASAHGRVGELWTNPSVPIGRPPTTGDSNCHL